MSAEQSVFDPVLPDPTNSHVIWARLYGSSQSLALTHAMQSVDTLVLVVTADTRSAIQFDQEVRFFAASENDKSIMVFPDWETLPYDLFSPHEDIVSQRLQTLNRLMMPSKGMLIVPISTLMQRLPPRSFMRQYSLVLEVGQQFDMHGVSRDLEQAGYNNVSQVMAHGEYCLRGSIIDLFPMGSILPFRIDLLGDEIESIRTFDPETQRSVDKVNHIKLLPGREFPLSNVGITQFRQNYRNAIEGDVNKSIIYREVSEGRIPSGLEYYLPLFFEQTETLFDYLQDGTLCAITDDAITASATYFDNIKQRYEQRRDDVERPVLPPETLYMTPEEINGQLQKYRKITIQRFEKEHADQHQCPGCNHRADQESDNRKDDPFAA